MQAFDSKESRDPGILIEFYPSHFQLLDPLAEVAFTSWLHSTEFTIEPLFEAICVIQEHEGDSHHAPVSAQKSNTYVYVLRWILNPMKAITV